MIILERENHHTLIVGLIFFPSSKSEILYDSYDNYDKKLDLSKENKSKKQKNVQVIQREGKITLKLVTRIKIVIKSKANKRKSKSNVSDKA